MAKRAGQIVISLTAGTAQFIQDLEGAKARVRDFGAQAGGHVKTFEAHTVTSMQASSAAIREAFGGSNVRAVERFIATTLGAGPALQAIFPLVGLAATGTLFVEVGEKAYKFFRDIQEAPQKAAGAFRELNAPLAITNDQLRLANDRLDNEIAKLEGRRTNNLKIALDEARLSADQLAESLEKDLKAIGKLLQENEVGFFKSRFGNERTDDIRKRFVTDSGNAGPIPQKVAEITDAGSAAILAAGTDKTKRDAAQLKLNGDLAKYYASQISELNAELVKAQVLQEKFVNPPKKDLDAIAKERAALGPYGGQFSREKLNPTEPGPSDQSTRINDLKGSLRYLNQQQAFIDLKAENEKKIVRKDGLESERGNEKLNRPFDNKIAELKAQLTAARADLQAAGLSEADKIVAKAFGASIEAIQKVNKERKELRAAPITDKQGGEISGLEQDKAKTIAEAAYQTKLHATTLSIEERIGAQRRLADAIGKSYEAVRDAAVETQVIQQIGLENYNDPKRRGDADILRSKGREDYDLANITRSKTAADALNKSIELEQILAKVQKEGAESVRLATVAFQQSELAKHNVTQEEIDDVKRLSDARKENLSKAELHNLELEIAATGRLTTAELDGAEAVRKAALENKYAKLRDEGVSADVVAATRTHDELMNQQQITTAALREVNVFKDQLFILDKQLDVVVKRIEKDRANVDLLRQRKDLENDVLKVLVNQELALGTARAGMRAFFLEMQEQGVTSARIINTALHSAVDGVSDSLAKAITGQKANWGQILKSIGQEMLRATLKQGIEKGLGELGKLIGIKPPATIKKPTGVKGDEVHVVIEDSVATAAGDPSLGKGPFGMAFALDGQSEQTAFWVRMAVAQETGASKIGGVGLEQGAGVLAEHISGRLDSWLGGLARGVRGLESVTSSIDFGVGSFASVAHLSNATAAPVTQGSGAGVHYHFGDIDARGATDPLIYQRIQQAVRAAHDAAVGNAVSATMELNKRTPQ